MARFLHFSSAFQSNRKDCYQLLAFLLIGALFGALVASLQPVTVFVFDFDAIQTSWIPIWFRSSLFPCLLAVSFLLRRKALFFLLFFLKGAFVSFTLCILSRFGLNLLLSNLSFFLIQTVLPLSIQLYVSSIWLRFEQNNASALFLLVPMILAAFLGALILMHLALG